VIHRSWARARREHRRHCDDRHSDNHGWPIGDEYIGAAIFATLCMYEPSPPRHQSTFSS
jgi:hypothetical protein